MEKVNRRQNSKKLTTNEDKVAVLLAAINLLITKETDSSKIRRKLTEIILPGEKKNIANTKRTLEKILQEVENNE